MVAGGDSLSKEKLWLHLARLALDCITWSLKYLCRNRMRPDIVWIQMCTCFICLKINILYFFISICSQSLKIRSLIFPPPNQLQYALACIVLRKLHCGSNPQPTYCRTMLLKWMGPLQSNCIVKGNDTAQTASAWFCWNSVHALEL